jgi:hypothetical protein
MLKKFLSVDLKWVDSRPFFFIFHSISGMIGAVP